MGTICNYQRKTKEQIIIVDMNVFPNRDIMSEDGRMEDIIGYTIGVFDLFHIGHLNILERAKRNCD
jgi:bifunctional ADP-heptose synthase (sugar kinase/adenylyltransferase)